MTVSRFAVYCSPIVGIEIDDGKVRKTIDGAGEEGGRDEEGAARKALVGKGRISGARKSVRGARSVMQHEASQHAS